jgi:hypothetical protein
MEQTPDRKRLRPRVKQARSPSAKQPRPKARCSECGTASVYTEHIGRRCARTWELPDQEEPERCEGRFKAAVSPGDWVVCVDCGATGTAGDAECQRCLGAGWRYVGREVLSSPRRGR